jgi:hypothetical protein
VNFNPLYPLSETEAEELAGCLFTSSAIERYERCLQTSHVVRRVFDELKAGSLDGNQLLQYGWFYRERLYETPGRNEWELPLAVLAFVLGRSGVANVDNLLLALSTSSNPQGTWLAALARRMMRNRSGSLVHVRVDAFLALPSKERIRNTAAPPRRFRLAQVA